MHAIRMMPEGSIYGGWPTSGEIDIMEHVNANGLFYGTLHFGKINKDGSHASAGGSKDLGVRASDWHTFGVQWSSQSISFLIDGEVYYK
jgi:beta-glucanase (GH16 family)